MTTETITDADQRLRDLVARAKAGESIVLADDTGPVAKLVPVEPSQSANVRTPGGLKGKLDLPDEFFFDPLPPDELKRWWPDDAAAQ